jgi:hypothetical protein
LQFAKTLHPDVLPASATAEAKSEARTRFVKALSEYEERTKAGSAGRLWVQGCEAADYHRHQHSREEEASHESEEGDYEVVWLYTKFKLLTAAAAAVLYLIVDAALRNQRLGTSVLMLLRAEPRMASDSDNYNEQRLINGREERKRKGWC